MKNNYLPMFLLVALVAAFAFIQKDKNADTKLLAVTSRELQVAPVAPDEMKTTEEEKKTNEEEEVIFKCKKETAPKAYELRPSNEK